MASEEKNFANNTEKYQRLHFKTDIDFQEPMTFIPSSLNRPIMSVAVVMIKLYPKPHAWTNVYKQAYVSLMTIKVDELFISVCCFLFCFFLSASFPK